MALGVPEWAWARCEVRHTQEGWPKARLAYLEHVRGKPGARFKWTLAGGLSAGSKVDRALDGCRFPSVPLAMEWIASVKWARNPEALREWRDLGPLT
jgi:hypothetical protein